MLETRVKLCIYFWDLETCQTLTQYRNIQYSHFAMQLAAVYFVRLMPAAGHIRAPIGQKMQFTGYDYVPHKNFNRVGVVSILYVCHVLAHLKIFAIYEMTALIVG